MTRMRPQYGYTVVEAILLVAIVTVLAATVYVLMGGARETGRQTICISNLRQIGQAVAMYRADYEEKGAVASSDPNVLVSLGVPERASSLFKGGDLKDPKMTVAHCPDDPMVERLKGGVFSYGWCALMPPTLPDDMARRERERYTQIGNTIVVAIDLHHWNQYYDKSALPAKKRYNLMFWLVLRFNGSVTKGTRRMPVDGACAL